MNTNTRLTYTAYCLVICAALLAVVFLAIQ